MARKTGVHHRRDRLPGLLDRQTPAALGASIVALVRDWTPDCEVVRSRCLEQVSVVRGDLRDLPLLERIIAEYEVKTDIHVAAQAIVAIANRSPVGTFETNILGTCNMLEACRRVGGVEQVLVASSDKAYGEQAALPYEEWMPLEGQHPYDVSKFCADLIACAYHKTYRLPVGVTRCGNFYGGGDLNWNRIVPGTIRSVLLGESPVLRSDGRYVRDYLYVEDGAAAYQCLAKRMAQDSTLAGEAFNFSNEAPASVLEVVNTILQIMDARHLQPVILGEARNEITSQYLSARKAGRGLGWAPAYNLESGLRRAVDWYRAYFQDDHKGGCND